MDQVKRKSWCALCLVKQRVAPNINKTWTCVSAEQKTNDVKGGRDKILHETAVTVLGVHLQPRYNLNEVKNISIQYVMKK